MKILTVVVQSHCAIERELVMRAIFQFPFIVIYG